MTAMTDMLDAILYESEEFKCEKRTLQDDEPKPQTDNQDEEVVTDD